MDELYAGDPEGVGLAERINEHLPPSVKVCGRTIGALPVCVMGAPPLSAWVAVPVPVPVKKVGTAVNFVSL